jgi:hypothetical protein
MAEAKLMYDIDESKTTHLTTQAQEQETVAHVLKKLRL